MNLTDEEKLEIRKLLDRPAYAGSERSRDAIRRRLKRLGAIWFDRKQWQWCVLPEAKEAANGSR